MQEIRIDISTAGGRLDKLLKKYLNNAPAGFVYKMLRKKNIVLNDGKASGAELLKDGDIVKMYLSDETIQKFHADLRKTKSSFDCSSMIIYEDDNLIAFHKPAGMLSQKSGKEDMSLNDILLEYLGDDPVFTPGISNRLDRNTSGIILAGKNPGAVRSLNTGIKNRSLVKLYLCFVKGIVPQDAAIEGYLSKNHMANVVQILPEPPKGREAEYSYIKTSYRVLSSANDISLLLVDLITGRSHQIRSHLASVGHPIIGDLKYGDKKINLEYSRKYGVQYQMLHAYCVQFVTMEGILAYLNGKSIYCSVPAVFQKIWKGEKLCLPGDPEDLEVLNLKPLLT